MNDPQFQYIAALNPAWGRPICMTQWRNDIFMAMENGQLIRISENFYTANVYLQEIHFPAAKPMPNPI